MGWESILRTITIQGLTLAAINAARNTLYCLKSLSMKCRSRSQDGLESILRTITIQGLTLAAINAARNTLNCIKSLSMKCRSRSQCGLEEHIKDNYYPRFDTCSY